MKHVHGSRVLINYSYKQLSHKNNELHINLKFWRHELVITKYGNIGHKNSKKFLHCDFDDSQLPNMVIWNEPLSPSFTVNKRPNHFPLPVHSINTGVFSQNSSFSVFLKNRENVSSQRHRYLPRVSRLLVTSKQDWNRWFENKNRPKPGKSEIKINNSN